MKKILIVSDSFLPEGNSAAVHMTELQKSFDEAGIATIVATSAKGYLDLGRDNIKNVVQFPNHWKGSNRFILRAFGELLSAVMIGVNLRFAKKFGTIDRVIVYSPSIFWSVTIKIADYHPSKVHYVIRDIFPFWLIKAGLLKRSSISYRLLDFFANLQFKTANKIFVQSEYDCNLLYEKYASSKNKIQILQTWMNPVPYEHNSKIHNRVDKSKKNILWLGTMGIPQNRDFTISILEQLINDYHDINLNIVGMKKHDLHVLLKKLGSLQNFHKRVKIIDQLSHTDCAQLAMNCDLGLFSLGRQTTQGNIPGKFITYLMSGIPVFGLCPRDAEVASLVKLNKLGRCYHGSCKKMAAKIIATEVCQQYDKQLIERYFQKTHSTKSAAKKLME